MAPPPFSERRKTVYVASLLALITVLLYWRTVGFEFIVVDDHQYVFQNSMVMKGLSWAGIKWAFTTMDAANWHPITWLSHALDCQLFGLQSGPHHLTNVLLHVLATLLLFAFLNRATQARWRGAFVAFLFALHPLHVESVAWVAERKDVLCALFWFLALWAYVRYSERHEPANYLLAL